MIPLSATVITYNEEANIRACLESLSWVPHILVIDSGSTDRTVDIAREFTDDVTVTDWPGHVEQKNRAVEHAPTDWVLSIDADERVTPELRAQIEAALAQEPRVPAFSMCRRTHYLGRWILHGGWYPDRKVRLFDRRHAHWGGTNPHDHVQVDGATTELAGDLHHYTYRDIYHHIEVMDNFTDIAAREREAKGIRPGLLKMVCKPPGRFLRMYLLKQGFRDGFAGFVVAVLAGVYVFLKEAKLWERRQLKQRGINPDELPRNVRGPEWRPPRRTEAS